MAQSQYSPPGNIQRDPKTGQVVINQPKYYNTSTYTPPPADDKPPSLPDRIRQFGQQMSNWWDQRGDRTQGYYQPADNAYNQMRDGRPDYLGDLYRRKAYQDKPHTTQYSQGLYQNQGSNPDYVRNAYLTNNPNNHNTNDLYHERQQSGYGSSDIQNRFKNRSATFGGSTAMDGESDNVRDFSRGDTVTGQRYSQRQGQGRDMLDDYFGQRQAGPRITAGMGGSAAGGLGPSRADDMMFDPTQTVALGDRYHQLQDSEETPGYLEDFYLKYQNGDNPESNRAHQLLSKSMERRAAATGGFNAGASMRQQGEADADLSAKEFGQLGALAGQAQGLKQERSRDVTGAAKSYEDAVLGNRGFNLSAAKQSDEFGLGKAKEMDDYGLGKGRLSLDEQGAMDRLAGQTSEADRAREDSLDKLAYQDEQSRENRAKFGSDWARDKDRAALDRETELDKLAGDSSTDQFAREKARDSLAASADDRESSAYRDKMDAAGKVTKEDMDFRDYQRGLAKDADSSSRDDARLSMDYDKTLEDLAKGASSEQQDYMKQLLDGAISLSRNKAGTAESYDKESGGAMSDAEKAAVDAELQKMGVDAEKRKQFWKTVGAIGGGIIGAAPGVLTANPALAGAGAVGGAKVGGAIGESAGGS